MSSASGFPLDTTTTFFRDFIGYEAAEDGLLRAFGATVPQAEKEAFVAGFYAHLGRFRPLARILSEPGRTEKLKKSLLRYTDSLLCDPVDDDYIAMRDRTGFTHLKIGLLPRWYLGAYSLFIDWWLPRLSPGPEGPARARAFIRRILLDCVMAMEAYVTARVDDLAEQKRSLDREVRERGRQLEESERRYEDLVENAPEMIHQVDNERRFLHINRTGLNRLGYTLEEMRGMSLEMIVPPAYRQGIIEHVERVKNEGSARLETVFVTREGREFPVEVYATAQRSFTGEFLQARAFVRDLSEHRRLQGELLRWERLATVGSMAAKVAHEIRNPLSAISLNVELMADELADIPDDKKELVQPLLGTILAGVDRLTALTEEYLAFARLPPLEMRETSLLEVFYQLDQLLRRDLERKGIAFTIDIPEDLPRVAGDGRQLEQVFLNLIRNSQDAMPDGGEVHVRAAIHGDGVEVSVSDIGIGIPEKSMPLIFDPFFTTKDSGTGLGLAYVQQVLQEHRGRISCHSRPGEGTEFKVWLQLAGRPRVGMPGSPPGVHP